MTYCKLKHTFGVKSSNQSNQHKLNKKDPFFQTFFKILKMQTRKEDKILAFKA